MLEGGARAPPRAAGACASALAICAWMAASACAPPRPSSRRAAPPRARAAPPRAGRSSFISSASRCVVTSVSCRTRSRSSSAAGALLHGLELLLEELVLLEQRLVVLGEILEERVHLLDVEAAEHPHRELLLADVHGRDAHGDLLSTGAEQATRGRITRSMNWMARITMSGERSSPPVFHGGSSRRTGRQHRLGDLAEEQHDRVARVGADPRDQRRGDDHLGVEVQQPAEEADELGALALALPARASAASRARPRR